MGKIIYFDYCALILLVTLCVSTVSRKMTKGKQNRFFLFLMIIALLSTIFDIWTLVLGKWGAGNVVPKYIAHSLYLFFHSLMTPAYIIYLVAQTDTWHILKKSKILRGLLTVPLLVVTVFLILNTKWHIVFYLDADDAYTRGNGFILLYVTAFIYIIFGIGYLIHYRRLFSTVRFFSLVVMFPLLVGALIIQFALPGYVVEMFANAVALLLITMLVQRPEDIIDVETGLLKQLAYSNDMKRGYDNEKPVQIIMVNIINFPLVREMLGYEAVNQLLCRIADCFVDLDKKKGLEANIYYLGNGKFRFVVEEKHFHLVEDMANAVNEVMKSDVQFRQMAVNLMSCVCIVRCPEDIDSVNSLFAFGDDLNTKRYTGKVIYAADVFRKEHYDLMRDIDLIIEQALAENLFMVYYQPIFSVREKRFNSAEALLRLKNDKYGFISPEVFIPAAEKSGAIHKIGEYVLEEVCRFIASEEYAALKLDYIEINLSVAQCMQSGLAQQIIGIIEKYQISTEQINLEITETAASYSQNMMMENMRILDSAGISFSLDDFGTGYSNMRRIASLPLHLVKLDKSFTNLEGNPKLQIILQNVVNMIKAMNMEIVVEGVETADMVELFSDMECEYIQGYYFSKPIPQSEFVEFIRNAQE